MEGIHLSTTLVIPRPSWYGPLRLSSPMNTTPCLGQVRVSGKCHHINNEANLFVRKCDSLNGSVTALEKEKGATGHPGKSVVGRDPRRRRTYSWVGSSGLALPSKSGLTGPFPQGKDLRAPYLKVRTYGPLTSR